MDDSRVVIELINKLQTYFNLFSLKNKLELPQIVVVGAQSSGKSSVLDGLVGFSILPRGSGTVTKCPIIVQLITIPEADTEDEGIEFEDDPQAGRFKNYDDVRERISELMGKDNGAIADTPIIIRVYSPNVVTLTVVDLPGIKRLTSTGEPSDLEVLIVSLSHKYISQKNAIILAVSPANYDICNSDGLLLARAVDPEGNRTIGVLTKLDLMDEGTNARELLTGTSKDVKIKLGMIGLVNRSQKDIENNLSIQDQLAKEADFLIKNYCDLAHKNGVPFLRKRLHELLVQHIRNCLPEVLTNLRDLMNNCNKRLEEIPNVANDRDKYMFVNNVINRFSNDVRTELEGSTRNPEYTYLYGGIQIKDILTKTFSRDMDAAGKRADAGLTKEMISNAFRNSGSFDSMFVYPEAVFKKLAQDQVKAITEPAEKCADLVFNAVMGIVERKLQEKEIEHFPELKKLMKSVVNVMMRDKLDRVKRDARDYIRIQSTVVFSLNNNVIKRIATARKELENFLRTEDTLKHSDETGIALVATSRSYHEDPLDSLPTVNDDDVAGPLTRPIIDITSRVSAEGDRIFSRLQSPTTTNLIKKMVKEYFDLIKGQTLDYIPKLVADRLITQFSTSDTLANELRYKINANYTELAILPDNLSENRENDVKLKAHLKEVIHELEKIHVRKSKRLDAFINTITLTPPQEGEESGSMDFNYKARTAAKHIRHERKSPFQMVQDNGYTPVPKIGDILSSNLDPDCLEYIQET